jgi:hypothetical protein
VPSIIAGHSLRVLRPLVFLLSLTGSAAEIKIVPKTPPVVAAGETVHFTANQPVEWSLAPGSKGTIDPDGLYHAPARIKAKQSLAGCQVLPNNHIFNTRIDSLPLDPKSFAWMHAKDPNGRPLASGRLKFNYGFPINVVTSHSPEKEMVFAYSPEADGSFHVLPPAEFKMESGYYSLPFSDVDRHSLFVESDTCNFQEMYNFYPAGSNTYNNCPKCTSQSGVKYSGSGYHLPEKATDAASLFLAPLAIHRDEVLAGSIEHAIRFTLLGSFIHASHIWPAVSEAGYNHADFPPFGARFRLRPDFSSDSQNPIVQTFLTQLKHYGLILADIGGQWEMDAADTDLYFDPEIRAAIQQLGLVVSPADFEVVDESSLMLNQTSGDTPVGAETVIATNKSGKSVSSRVVLEGVTIGVDSQYLVFQAGAPAHHIEAWINGSADKGVIWGMNPSVGTLSASGVYTPPEHIAARQQVLLVAKAHADPRAFTSMKVTLLPEGPIRIDNGNPASYKDSKGNVWESNCCSPWDVIYKYPGSWPATPDINLYEDDAVNWSDLPYEIFMAPGKYRILVKDAEPTYTSPHTRLMSLEAQGKLIYRDLDLFAQAGLRTPIDFTLPADVGSDGKLRFVVRHVLGEQTLIGAFEVLRDPGAASMHISPEKGGTLTLSESKQFYALPWYVPDERVTWSLSPQLGSIDTDGRYKAPSIPVSHDTAVTITAASVANPSLQAHAEVLIKAGIPTIRINCGGNEFVDAQHHTWAGDRGYEGGTKYGGATPIKDAPAEMQILYQTSRYAYGTQSFSYTFPMPNGSYSVKLMWAEYRTAAEVSSLHMLYKMNVSLNGKQVLANFDPIAAAGGVQTSYEKTFAVNVTRGEIQIVFAGQPGAGYVGSAINGIEIEPTGNGSVSAH